MKELDWSGLDSSGWVLIPRFLDKAAARRISGNWKETATKNQFGKASTFAPDTEDVTALKGQLGEIVQQLASSRDTTLEPDPAALRCSPFSTYFHVGGFDGPAASIVPNVSRPDSGPWHTDRHTMWEYTDNNTHFLNLYLPIEKPSAHTANLRLVPYNVRCPLPPREAQLAVLYPAYHSCVEPLACSGQCLRRD